jgi:Protein of unknown function (DUF1552)
VLSSFAPLKTKMNVFANLENVTAFSPSGAPDVEPAHGRQPGGWLTCMDAAAIRSQLKVSEANGVSVDQTMAEHAVFKGKTPIASMQLGLSTVYGYCDAVQCSNSRSVSWKTMTQPMYKMVDPLQVFNTITGVIPGGGAGTTVDAAAARRPQTRVTVEHFGWDSIPERHAARHGFPLGAFQLRLAEWWQVLLVTLRHRVSS